MNGEKLRVENLTYESDDVNENIFYKKPDGQVIGFILCSYLSFIYRLYIHQRRKSINSRTITKKAMQNL